MRVLVVLESNHDPSMLEARGIPFILNKGLKVTLAIYPTKLLEIWRWLRPAQNSWF